MNAYAECLKALDKGWLPVVVPCDGRMHIVEFKRTDVLARAGAYHPHPQTRQAVVLGAALRAVEALKEHGCSECTRDSSL